MAKYYGIPDENPNRPSNAAVTRSINQYIKTHKSSNGDISTKVNIVEPGKPKVSAKGNTSRRQSALNGFARAIGLGGAIADDAPSKPKKGHGDR